MLAQNCAKCSNKKACAIRFISVKKGDTVYCPDGSSYIVTAEYTY